MRPMHRMPSSIRVRRSDTDSNRNNYYSSADIYNQRSAGANTPAPAVGTQIPSIRIHTPAQSAQASSDYFTSRNQRRASAATPGRETIGTTREAASPSAEGQLKGRRGSAASQTELQRNDDDDEDDEEGDDDDDDDDDDDNYLRREMHAARLAIHNQYPGEHQGHHHHHHSHHHDEPHGDFPPIRLSDESQEPRVPSRTSSRRPGAVEGLAMRHRRLHKDQRRQKRKEHRASVSTTSSQSSASNSGLIAENNESRTRRDGAGAAMHPPNNRNLSDVQEEGRYSQAQTPSVAQPGQAEAPSQEAAQTSTRPRRNTVADEGLMATSRRIYDNLLRRRSDLHNTTTKQQQSSLPQTSQEDHNDYANSLDTPASSGSSDMHEDEVVDYLDVVDPEIATVTALQNVGNSIFFPPIPMLYNRRPTISLPSAAHRRPSYTPHSTPRHEVRQDDIEMGLRPSSRLGDAGKEAADGSKKTGFDSIRRVTSLVPGRKKKDIPATTEEERRKHIQEWAQMDEEERNELDEHVHMLLTKKAKAKRMGKGFLRYVKTPHGLIITVYAFLITFWGTAIVLFLLRWINVHNHDRQRYWIEICDQILCALFTAVGLGFAPFRAVDTYRMAQIAHYHFLTYKRRRQLNLPELKDKNELPRASERLDVSQMTENMLIKTGLKKAPAQAGVDSADADGSNTSGETAPATGGDENHMRQGTSSAGQSTDSSWELLDATTSRQSGPEVEELKEKRKHKHKYLHRKHRDDKKEAEAGDKSAKRHKKREGSESPKKPPHKTYANKDGIIPLGQLKRNPSIASELPRDAEDVVVLSPKQQANLEYQQRKFHESHTFYRYRETVTHRPFELSLMMAVVILLDCHSCLQASLGGTTWGIYYKRRPTSVTATIITFSLSCNAVAGFLIWWGGSRTKKKEEVERLLRIALEEEALRKMKKRRRRQLEAERQAKLDWDAQGRELHPGKPSRGSDNLGREWQLAPIAGEGMSEEEQKKRDADEEDSSKASTPAGAGASGRAAEYAEGVTMGVQQTPGLECIHEH